MSLPNTPFPPVLQCIAQHESQFRQFNADGTPLISPTGDAGLYQINIKTWKPLADKMGLDFIHSPVDNVEMAAWIYNKEGVSPWVTKKYCGGVEDV